MKPAWKDAPEWANYLAMDKNDRWFWYEYKPWTACRLWWFVGKCQVAKVEVVSWKDSLEKRPGDSTTSDEV